jgi:hypothetical protein
MTRTIAAAIFALLAVTAPAHAAYVTELGASVDLNLGSSTQLTGTFDLGWLPVGFGGAACCRVNDYYFTNPPSLSLNGVPVTLTGIPENAFPSDGTIGIFVPSIGPLDFYILGINTNFLPPNPTFANFLLDGSPATSGTVTVNSETLATPLPAALPLFGSAFAGLGGIGWLKRRKVSTNRKT